MTDLEWPLCVIEETDPDKLKAAYLSIYLAEYVNADIRDWAGRRICFHAPTFKHAFSQATNYRTSAGVHDVDLSLARAERIHWIKLALASKDIEIEVLGQIRKDNRGRPKRRRTIIVLDNNYVVVLELCEEPGYDFQFISAFPAENRYLEDIRRQSAVMERRKPGKKMPQSYGD